MKRPKLSGRLNLVFQERASSRWENRVGPIRCKVTYLRGGEQVIADRLLGKNTCVIQARATAVHEVRHTWRIKDETSGQVFDIKSYIETDDRHWVDFTCQTERAS